MHFFLIDENITTGDHHVFAEVMASANRYLTINLLDPIKCIELIDEFIQSLTNL